MTEYVHVGSHADTLASGRIVGPGERVTHTDLGDEDQHIVDEGRLVDVASFGGDENTLSGKRLQARAAELDIEGRSSMSADDLRAAIAEREAEEAQHAA